MSPKKEKLKTMANKIIRKLFNSAMNIYLYSSLFLLTISLYGCCSNYINKHSEITCGDCKIIDKLSPDLEVLHINFIKNCRLDSDQLFSFSDLRTVIVEAKSVAFTEPTSENTSIESFAQLSPFMDSVPSVVYKMRSLKSFTGAFLTGQLCRQSEAIPGLERVVLNVKNINEPIDYEIIQSPSLKELNVYTKSDKVSLSGNFRFSEQLRQIKLPIDLSECIDAVIELDKLESLFVKSISDIRDQEKKLLQLKSLKRLYATDISIDDIFYLRNLLPSVEVAPEVMFHITPAGW